VKLDRWIPLAEAARIADVPLRRFRRRMHALNRRTRGALMKNFAKGEGAGSRWHVSAEALLHQLRSDPEIIDEKIAELERKVADHETKLTALRDSYRAFRRKAHAWFEAADARNRE